MIKLWSEITSGSSTICYGPYLLHKTIFPQNGLRNFRLQPRLLKFWFFYAGSLLCALILTVLKFQSKFSHDRSVYGLFHLKPLILDKIPTTFQAF